MVMKNTQPATSSYNDLYYIENEARIRRQCLLGEYRENIQLLLPDGKPIVLGYQPDFCGNIIGQVISCNPEFNGQEQIDYLLDEYSTYKQNWSKHHGPFHNSIHVTHIRSLSFDEWLSKEKLILVRFRKTEPEINFLLNRHYSTNSAFKNLASLQSQMYYYYELIRFLDTNNKDYFNFELSCMLKSKDFCNGVNLCFEFLNLPTMNTQVIEKIYKKWQLQDTISRKKSK